MTPSPEARVVVVGGGIAGVSIAYELAARAQVVLLEQEERLAYHTTGRSAAMYLESYGNPLVRAITAASRQGFDDLQRAFNTPPLLTPLPHLWTADHEHVSALDSLLQNGDSVEAMPAPEAVRMCPALRLDRLAGAAMDTSGMKIDVEATHRAYVLGLRRREGEIRISSPLIAAAHDGDVWRLDVPGGVLTADILVNAAGAWADVIAAAAGVEPVGLRPLRRTIFTCPLRWPTPTDGWPFVADVAGRFYFQAEHDYVLVSPADETPDQPGDARPVDEDIARAIEVVNEFTLLGLRSVRTSWAGLRSFVADRSPVVGTRPGESSFFWFAAQGGYGIQMAPALARVGASLALDGRLPDDVTKLGVATAQLAPDRFGRRPPQRAMER